MDCLDANAVQDLMSDALDASVRKQVMGHLDTCSDCRELVGVLAKETIRESSQPGTGLEATPRTTMPAVALGLDATVASGAADPLAETAAGTDRTPKLAGISVGRVLGKFTLVERLGAGAMGVVYRGEDKDLSRSVAVKVLHRPDDALTERLVREARSMAQVNHPNVVAVYDVGTSDTTTYIAMELVPGQSLRTWQQTPRTVQQTIDQYVEAGRGLAAAHAAGIVHRDFKPDNVLVGRDGRARVTDFGLAAARPTDGSDGTQPDASSSAVLVPSDLSLTRSGTVLGTPAYMAPEQFEGGNVDARTDQFNFCVALYEALYKERPFVGKTFEELADNVIEGKLRPARAKSGVSNALRAIIVRGLSSKPGDRYPTMDHLLDELARDRAKPWRRASAIAATVGIVLAFFLAADWAVRARLTDKATRSFQATGKQIDRTARLIVSLNAALSTQAKLFSSMIDISSYKVDEEFGLGGDEDPKVLDELHESLASTSWARIELVPGHPSVVAVSDYKGRLFYTSASDQFPKTDLRALPGIRAAMDVEDGNNMRLVSYDDPVFVATRLRPGAHGMGVMFTRSGRGSSACFMQLFDADDVLASIKLDDTLLSIVAPDGAFQGNVPPELIARMTTNDVREISIDNATYQVQGKPIVGPDKQPVGRFVMATRIDGVLSLFPGARTVFAIALVVVLLAALATFLRTRHLVQ